MRGNGYKGVGICHWCKSELVRFEGQYASRDPNDLPMPEIQTVGWMVCLPACPDRPESAIVVRLGLGR